MRARRKFSQGGNSVSKSRLQQAVRRSRLIEVLEDRLLLTTVPYTFQNVNIGAGGFVDGIFYDPKNANTIYARTDIGGLYKSTNDGTSWSQLLDFVGNNTTGSQNGTQSQEIGVLSFAIDPENSNNLYADVGEYTGSGQPDGAVFYSTNAGLTWSIDNLSFQVGGNSNGRGDGEQIAVDPNDSNIIFLGTNANGLWESTNAGQSFSKVSSFTPTSTTFVLFNPSGTVGSPSQTIFVGIDSTSSTTNLYETTNGGTSWAVIPQSGASGTFPTKYLPGHAVLSGGYLYLGYANAEAPNGSITNGGVYRYQLSTGTWANISPVATSGKFGYDGVAADPNNPNTIVVTSFDFYSGPDQMWRTVNANAATPTWTEVYDYSTAQDNGYEGFDTTRNTTNAPWTADFGDGISNWAAAVAINPFNSNQLMYGTGQGIWATNNISNNGTNTQLTEANSWYFPDTGIEFTAVGGVAAPTAGTPLYSAMGDIGGFANTTLTFSPAAGSVGGSGYSTDYAGTVPSDAVIVGSMGTTDGIYTTNGVTFSAFAGNPSSGTAFTEGTVAISANGSTIVWAPSGQAAYYSTNNGSSWTLSTLTGGGGLPTGGVIVSDKVNPNYFYYWTENSSDNSWTLYVSSNGGQTFAESAGGAIGTGNVTLAVNQYVAGQLWISSYIGMYESTNFGASFTHVGSYSAAANTGTMALGAPAPGGTIPAIYIYGTIASGGFEGLFRSDDGGNTWLQLNTTSEQWGGLIQTLAADPNVFGRVYIGINGRGIIMGNPSSSLPAGWVDTDINEPGNPGWATSSTTLSTGSVVNQWTINGGGAGVAATSVTLSSLTVSGDVATAVTSGVSGFQVGQTIFINGASNAAYDGYFVITGLGNTPAGIASEIGAATEFTFNITEPNATVAGTITATLEDQLNFAYEPVSGNAVAISAELTGLTNTDNGKGTSEAGVMIRNGTSPTSPFVALFQTAAGNLVFEDRSDGALDTQTVTGVPVGSEYVEIIGTGNGGYTGYYSANGTSWTQIGFGVTVPTSGSLNVGLAATADYNPQLTSATFTNLVISTGPTVTQAAAANPNPVDPFITAASTALSAGATENGSGSGLTYTWAYTGPTGVTYTGNTNGTNAAQNITADFTQTGTYNFTVTIADSLSLTTTSSVQVIVDAAFASQSGSTLDITLNSAGSVAIEGSGGTITASENGFQASFTGVSAINVTDSGSGDTLNYLGGITSPFTFTGAGTSTLDVLTGTLNFAGASTIALGVLDINSTGLAAVPVNSAAQTQLLVSGISITGGTLDLSDNEMFITYGSGSDPMSVIYSYLQSGYNNGNWNGPGIISTSASTPTNGLNYGLGFSDGKDGIVSGLSSGQIEIRYTLLGDANLDGTVNGSDFSILSANFGLGYTNWDQGNFLFGSSVNGSDFSALSANFGQGMTLPAVALVEAPAAPVVTTTTTTSSSATSTPPSQILDPVQPVLKKKPRHGDRR